MFGTDDEEDFAPQGNSKLASLFGSSSDPGNASLVYTAPKQPRKGSRPQTPSHQTVPSSSVGKETASSPKLSVILVKVVHSYKLEDGSYTSVGKLGAAILGSPLSHCYQLVLYRGQHQHIALVKITASFQFTVQPNNYASFYDEKHQNWSIMFESVQDILDFSKEVVLARANSAVIQFEQSVLVQDLVHGDADTPLAKSGDLIDVHYSVAPLVDGKLQPIIPLKVGDKITSVTVGKGTWEEFLKGVTKGCKRIIVLHQELFGDWSSSVPSNCRLFVEVQVVRVKEGGKEIETEVKCSSNDDSVSIKAIGASISEALTNSPCTNRANLISRMAKMGTPTLPLKGAIPCNPSDSEDTEDEVQSTVSRPSDKPIRKIAARTSASVPIESDSPVASSETSVSPLLSQICQPPQHTVFPYGQRMGFSYQQQQQQIQPVFYQNQHWPVQPTSSLSLCQKPFIQESQTSAFLNMQSQYPPAVQQPIYVNSSPNSDSQLAVYLADSRSQTSEIRQGVDKLLDKVEIALAKLDVIRQPPSQSSLLDPHTLLASIQKLVTDNDKLQTDLAEKQSKLDQQSDRIFQLVKYMDQNNSTTPDTSLQNIVTSLTHEKSKLSQELENAIAASNITKNEISNLQKLNADLQCEVVSLKSSLNNAQDELKAQKQMAEESHQALEKTKQDLDVAVKQNMEHESTISDLKKSIVQLQNKITNLSSSPSNVQQEKSQLDITVVENQWLLKLNEQKETLKKEYSVLIENLRAEKLNLLQQVEKLESKPAVLHSNQSEVNGTIDEIKKVMNVIYRQIIRELTAGETYDAMKIKEIVLIVLKDVMAEYMRIKSASENVVKEDVASSCNQSKTDETSSISSNNKSNKPSENMCSVDIASKISNIDSNIRTETLHNGVTETECKTDDHSVCKSETEDNLPPTSSNCSIKESDGNLNGSVSQAKDYSKDSVHNQHKIQTPTEESLKTNVLHEIKLHEKSEKDDINSEESSETNNVQEKTNLVQWTLRLQPPPPPLFDDDDDQDDWLN